jgi:hypothetical protein
MKSWTVLVVSTRIVSLPAISQNDFLPETAFLAVSFIAGGGAVVELSAADRDAGEETSFVDNVRTPAESLPAPEGGVMESPLVPEFNVEFWTESDPIEADSELPGKLRMIANAAPSIGRAAFDIMRTSSGNSTKYNNDERMSTKNTQKY